MTTRRTMPIALLTMVFAMGCEGTIGEGGRTEPGTDPMDPRFEARVWRLSPPQLELEIERLFGPEAPAPNVPPGAAEYGLTNIAATGRIDTGNAGLFVEGIRAVGEWAATNGATAARCDSYGTDACIDQFMAWFPEAAFRGPVTDDEITELRMVFEQNRTDYDYDYGFASVVRAVLLSPRFLYRWELGEPGNDDAIVDLDPYEIANLMAFSITDRAPDDELLAAAAAGELDEPDVREAHARRLMDRSDAVWQRFFWEWLEMATLQSQGNEVGLPPSLVAQMEEEYQTFVSNVVVENRGTLRDLLTSDQTWAQPELAEYYGVSHPGSGLQPITMDASQRSGLLTQGAWLVAHGKDGRANVVRRGMAVFRDAMCRNVTPLDIDLEAALDELVGPDATVREIVVARGEAPTCGACHRLADPIGLAFEGFAGDGSWQTTYAADGNPVETNINFPGAGEIDGATDLSQILADDQAFRSCLVQRFAHFLMGGQVGSPEIVRWTGEADQAFLASGGNFEELLVDLVRDPAFIERRKP